MHAQILLSGKSCAGGHAPQSPLKPNRSPHWHLTASRRGENLEFELSDQLRDLEVRDYERLDQKNTLLFNARCRFANVVEADGSGNGRFGGSTCIDPLSLTGKKALAGPVIGEGHPDSTHQRAHSLKTFDTTSNIKITLKTFRKRIKAF
jgi:hypothetical protein